MPRPRSSAALLTRVLAIVAGAAAPAWAVAAPPAEAGSPPGNAAASLDVGLVAVPPGSFSMGDDAGHFDERPRHEVTISAPFSISSREVSNALFEQFDPEHRRFRSQSPLSKLDDDPVVFVAWDEAVAFCQWLSQREGRTFRLPTEAEWEYARRTHPETFASESPLIENWCHDWYGPYHASAQTDPLGYASGDSRVTRGGPHRAADGMPHVHARSGNLPGDRNRLVGFRIVEGAMPAGALQAERPQPRWAVDVTAERHSWTPRTAADKPYFADPLAYVRLPADADGPLYTDHNHDPALAYCGNGDLLAIWYSCRSEAGRELAIAASRLRRGADAWDEAELFWDVPGRNDHAPALWTDDEGALYHFNGLEVDTEWDELALVMRTSADHGATWSPARLIDPLHREGNQPIASVFADPAGTIYVPCDAVSGGHGGTVLHASKDGGQSWRRLSEGQPAPQFAAGATGAWIAGIHAGVAALADGTLVALGRGDSIDGKMPMSRSTDGGRTWTYSASPFPPLGSGQRLVLRRLHEGPLLLISFTPASTFTDAQGNEFRGHGMFAALSDDGGRTWPVRKLLTDGQRRQLDGRGHTKRFTIDATHAEPKGYLTAVQSPDGVIHLISSGVHYRFNLAWLREPAPAAAAGG